MAKRVNESHPLATRLLTGSGGGDLSEGVDSTKVEAIHEAQ